MKNIIKPALIVTLLFATQPIWAMHIAEGFMPAQWCLTWGAFAIPFVVIGLWSVKKQSEADPKVKLVLGICGAFVFVLSALKLPSVTGSCSHLCGTSLGALLIGPFPMAVIGLIVLLFQALLLAHGGITTLGANMTSMAIAGPFLAYAIFKLLRLAKTNEPTAVFVAAFAGSLFTYVVTSLQLSWAFPDASGGWIASFGKFATLFAVTQLPLSVIEGFVTMYIYKIVKQHFNTTHLPS